MAAVAQSVSRYKQDFRAEDLYRKKLYHVDFSGQDLARLKLKQSLFFCCNFNDADMSEADCEGSEFTGSTFKQTNCYRTDFKNAKLAGTVFEPKDCMGMTVTMQCSTFENMKTSQMWFWGMIMLAMMMNPSKLPDQKDPRDMIIAALGAERYVKLRNLFSKREL